MACVTTRKMKISGKFLDEFSMIRQQGLSQDRPAVLLKKQNPVTMTTSLTEKKLA